MSRSTAYDEHPEHRLEVDAQRVRARVTLDGEILAETTQGLHLRESRYPAVVYIPRADVRMDRLVRSERSTHCPFKGDASYFEHRGDGHPETDRQPIAWSYETPFDQMAAIRDHLAFYPDRVTFETRSD